MSTVLSRTIYGAAALNRLAFGKSIPIAENSTLNEYVRNSNYVPFQPVPPTRGMETPEPYNFLQDSQGYKLKYFAIGNKGFSTGLGGATGPAGSIPLNTPVEHLATDSGLFNMIPFALVPVANDLPTIEKAKYRIRVTMDIGGTLYAAYYLKVLDVDSIEFSEVLVTKENGVESATAFVPSSSNLFPVHPPTSGATRGDYTRSMSTILIDFTEVEQQRLVEACRLLYGSAEYATISEVAFCAGVDKPITKRYPETGVQTPQNVSAGRLEAVAVQVWIHYTLSPVDVASARNGLNGAWDVGLSEPLYGKKSV